MERFKNWIAVLEANKRAGWIVQFIRFGIVGLSNTLVSLGVYYLCCYGLHLHYQAANLLGFLVSTANAYYWNSRYVFKAGVGRTGREHLLTYLKTLLGYGGTYFLSVALMWLWVERLGVSKGVAPVMSLFITIPLNYVINKFWTFKR